MAKIEDGSCSRSKAKISVKTTFKLNIGAQNQIERFRALNYKFLAYQSKIGNYGREMAKILQKQNEFRNPLYMILKFENLDKKSTRAFNAAMKVAQAIRKFKWRKYRVITS